MCHPMTDLDLVLHFKQGLKVSIYNAPTDVDDITWGLFKTLKKNSQMQGHLPGQWRG